MDVDEVQAALMEGMLASPIEEWMSFLHPDQAKLARRSFNGPARIRGAAGTGKTVVGLHRAAYLARTRRGKVLVTTFVRTLPDVLQHLVLRLAPEVADRIEFLGVHAFALRLLKARGVTVKLDPKAADAAFVSAWSQVPASSPLKTSSAQPGYWREDIDDVLKGRGITRWEVYSAYDAELRRRGVHDYADVILLAEAEVRRQPLDDAYAGVIVDEAQDLSCAMVRMLHALVADVPDGFTLIGDGQSLSSFLLSPGIWSPDLGPGTTESVARPVLRGFTPSGWSRTTLRADHLRERSRGSPSPGSR